MYYYDVHSTLFCLLPLLFGYPITFTACCSLYPLSVFALRSTLLRSTLYAT